MEEYIRSLLLVGAVAVLASLLLPQKPESTRRLLELALSLLVLTVICRPLAGGLLSGDWLKEITLPSYEYTDELLSPDTLAEMEEAVGKGISQDLAAQYGVSAACIEADASLLLSEGELVISSLTLTFRGEGTLLDHYAVQQYAERSYQTRCEVKIYGG